jgi:hypothetical protein
MQLCHSLGMRAISLETGSERRCFIKYLDGKFRISKYTFSINKNWTRILENWKLNSNYWSGGIRTNNSVQWCSTNQYAIQNMKPHIKGLNNSNFDGNDCLRFRIFRIPDPTSKHYSFTWNYEMKNCSTKAIYGCQVHLKRLHPFATAK